MFFPDKIKNIKLTDKVLEIGPGANPHSRSDVLLELQYETDLESQAQFGYTGKLNSDKKIVFYKGEKFPFLDKEFDYVICSHVIEHVENPEKFLSEIFRVASKGYFEYPLIYYEYLYNFDVHRNFVKFNGEKMWYIKKEDVHLEEFRPVQHFFVETLKEGYSKLIDDLLPLFMEGFEWDKKFEIIRSRNINDVVWKNFSIPKQEIKNQGTDQGLIRRIINKFIP